MELLEGIAASVRFDVKFLKQPFCSRLYERACKFPSIFGPFVPQVGRDS